MRDQKFSKMVNQQELHFNMNSSSYLNMHVTQEIQEAVVRIELEDFSTPLDIAAHVAPNLSSLEAANLDFHNGQEIDREWLQTNARILATTSMNGEHHSEHQNLQDPAANADVCLSWQQASWTTMSDTEYQHIRNCASTDQKAVIDQVFTTEAIYWTTQMTNYYCS